MKNNTKCSYEDIETIFNLNEIREYDRDKVSNIFKKYEHINQPPQ